MKKPVKIAGIIGAALLVLIAGVAILAKVLITPERVKKTVLPVAEKTLQRPVQLGEIKVSIFSGIVLKQLAILEKDGSEAFVKADRLQLRYQFWPLLSGRVVVDEVRLDRPAIRIVRFPDGTFNYSDIVAKKRTSLRARTEKGNRPVGFQSGPDQRHPALRRPLGQPCRSVRLYDHRHRCIIP